MIALVDLVGLFLTGVALAAAIAYRGRRLRLVDRVMVLSILSLALVISAGNFLEWSGITAFFDTYEDYMHVLMAGFWGFFLASLAQGRYEEALIRSEARYQDLVQSANSVILRWDTGGRVLFLNRYGLDFFGYSEQEILGRSVVGTIVPESETTGRDLVAMIDDICRHPERYVLNENENVKKGGQRVWISWTNRPMVDEEGVLREILSIGNDVTDRKRAEMALRRSLSEKEVLLKEVHHRVKNNLQVISGLLNLQGRHVGDPKSRGVFKESQNRVITMALIHERLYQELDLSNIQFGEYLRVLAESLFASYGVDRGRVKLVMETAPAELVVDTAIPCGLIVNELVSNSLRHAFGSEGRGEIRIGFRRLGTGDYELAVSDDGPGIPAGVSLEKPRSLGLQLVRLLAEQLGADFSFDRREGTTFRFQFKEYREAGSVLT